MFKFLFFFIIIGLISSQELSYIKVKNSKWDINLQYVIVHTDKNYSDTQIKIALKSLGAISERKINGNNYYLIKIKNASKTFIIYQKQINELKKIELFNDIIPLQKFNDIFTTLLMFEESYVKGFTPFKNDSIYKMVYSFNENLKICGDEELRNNPRMAKGIKIKFDITKGESKNIIILDTDVSEQIQTCIKRIIANQFWNNEQFLGSVVMQFVMYSNKY